MDPAQPTRSSMIPFNGRVGARPRFPQVQHDAPYHRSQQAVEGSTFHKNLQDLLVLDDCLTAGKELTEAQFASHRRLVALTSDHISEILPGLYLGNRYGAESAECHELFGITHIVNVAVHCQRSHCHQRMGYLHIKALDNESERLLPHFLHTVAFIRNAIEGGGHVFVHCYAGISRSATMVLAYLISAKNMRLSNAWAFLKDKRPMVRPNATFCAELRMLEKDFFGESVFGGSDTVALHSRDVLGAKISDWKEAFKYCLRVGAAGRTIDEHTGQCEVLWTKFGCLFAEEGEQKQLGEFLRFGIKSTLAYGDMLGQGGHKKANSMISNAFNAIMIMGCQQLGLMDRERCRRYIHKFKSLAEVMKGGLDHKLFKSGKDSLTVPLKLKVLVWPRMDDDTVPEPRDTRWD